MSREASSFESKHKSRRQADPALPGWEGASRILLRLVDAGLLGVIFVAPLFMGGRGDIGRLVYVALVCGTAVCWLVRQCLLADASWRWSGLEWILLAGVLLVVLQLAPLPPGVLRTLSPQIPGLLPLWTTQASPETQLGVWNQLTLSPQATRGGLITFLAHALLFLVLVQRIRDVHDVKRLVRWLALAAIGMAVLGLAQMLFGNGKFLWIYEHPSRDTYRVVKGSFQNQNHFAHFLALGIGPLLWWLHRLWTAAPKASFGSGGRSWSQSEILKHALTIGLGLVAFAGLLTFSRGGVLSHVCGSRNRLGPVDPAGPAGQEIAGGHRRADGGHGGGPDDLRLRAARPTTQHAAGLSVAGRALPWPQRTLGRPPESDPPVRLDGRRRRQSSVHLPNVPGRGL